MKDWIVDIPGWRQNKKDTWLVFSDEIPFWIKVGLLKTIFACWETKSSASTKKARQDRDKHRFQASQMLETEGDAEKEKGGGDESPGKGGGTSGGKRWRGKWWGKMMGQKTIRA